MTFAIRSRAVCVPLESPPKIGKHCLAMPIIRWQVITRVPMWGAC